MEGLGGGLISENELVESKRNKNSNSVFAKLKHNQIGSHRSARNVIIDSEREIHKAQRPGIFSYWNCGYSNYAEKQEKVTEIKIAGARTDM